MTTFFSDKCLWGKKLNKKFQASFIRIKLRKLFQAISNLNSIQKTYSGQILGKKT